MARIIKKRKVKRNIPNGVAHIHSTFNNTIVTICDTNGNAVSWSSAGALGFKGSKKSTPFAAQMASEAAAKAALDAGMIKIEVEVKATPQRNLRMALYDTKGGFTLLASNGKSTFIPQVICVALNLVQGNSKRLCRV